MRKKEIKKYIDNLPNDRKKPFIKLQKTIRENIPEGFEEVFSYNMVAYVVSRNLYPAGYHCTPELELPFIHIGNQKNSINLYHMAIYSDKKLLDWFVKEWPKYNDKKLDMGKSCIRFKNIDNIPYELIEKLVKKMSAKEWIKLYEKNKK